MQEIIDIYYDKECPFCKQYAKLIRLKESYEVNIYNAREHKETIAGFKKKGVDINEGMIIQINHDTILQGSHAIAFIDRCSVKQNAIVQTKFFAKVVYPLLKLLRKLWLKFTFKNRTID